MNKKVKYFIKKLTYFLFYNAMHKKEIKNQLFYKHELKQSKLQLCKGWLLIFPILNFNWVFKYQPIASESLKQPSRYKRAESNLPFLFFWSIEKLKT